MLIMLPNGFIDGIDLFNYADVDELRGKQQNYLSNKDLVIGNIGHVPKILKDMLLSLQTKEGLVWKGNMEEALQKLSIGDIETIFIKVRENTYGPRFYHEAVCEHCEYVNKSLRLDLDKLELTVMTAEELLKPKVLTLPKSGKEAELKPLYLKDLFEVVKITKSKYDSLITSTVCTAVKRIGDKTPIVPEDLENMAAVDLNAIQEAISEIKLNGSIDTLLVCTCQNCKKDFEARLNVFDPNFFSPSKASMSTNT